MKAKYLSLMCLSSIMISALLSIFICFFLQKNIVSIDLLKVLNAQAFDANRKIYKSPGSKNWIHSIKKVNVSMRHTIALIAGKRAIVIVSPAIIQGVEDITDKVLVALDLPKDIPNIQSFFTSAIK